MIAVLEKNSITSLTHLWAAYERSKARRVQSPFKTSISLLSPYWPPQYWPGTVLEYELEEAKVIATTTEYIHPDHLGSTNAVTDSTGEVIQTLDYYPYGSKRIESSSDVSQREFIGQHFDEETDLSYLNARYYENARGQFESQDPVFWEVGQTEDGRKVLSNPQAQNSYGYALNNPLRYKDPEGKYAEISGSIVVPGRTFSMGIRFDGSGVDGFFGGGFGAGLSGGLNVAWAPGVPLSHRSEGTISANGTAAYYVGGRYSQDLLAYYPDTKNSSTLERPNWALTLGLGLSASIETQVSKPLYTWSKNNSASPTTQTPTPLSPSLQSSYSGLTKTGFSSTQSSAAMGVAGSFGFSSLNSSQIKAIQSVGKAFSK